MEIPETERKLREAEFFLAHLRAEPPPAEARNEEVPLYYVSAFLSAGRSVTLVLQTELGWGSERYRPWFDGWAGRLATADRDLLTFMNDQRVAEVHQKGARVTTTVDERTEFILPRPGTTSAAAMQIVFGWYNEPGAWPATVAAVKRHFETKDGQVDVLQVGARYLELLRQLVEEVWLL